MSTISNIETNLQKISPWVTWIANILKAAAGTSNPTTATAATVVSTTATAASTASFSLGLTSDIGEGFKAISSVANLVTQRDKELNTPEMQQAANASKIQALKDHAAAVIDYAEKTGDMIGIKLLLS